jgi:hypothetical protein
MKSFVNKLFLHILQWFAIAATEGLSASQDNSTVTSGGREGFARVASFVGHLIKCGLLSHDLMRRHLIKPLIAHHSYNYYRANTIYQLFAAAGKTLLQGLLEPGDVQACFEILDTLTGRGVELECTVQLLPQCVTFRPNLCTRNFARYMLRGCSTGRRKSEGMSQKLNREIGQSLISLQRLEHPCRFHSLRSPHHHNQH